MHAHCQTQASRPSHYSCRTCVSVTTFFSLFLPPGSHDVHSFGIAPAAGIIGLWPPRSQISPLGWSDYQKSNHRWVRAQHQRSPVTFRVTLHPWSFLLFLGTRCPIFRCSPLLVVTRLIPILRHS